MTNVGFDKLIKKNASVEDTLDLIVKVANECSKKSYVNSIVKRFSPIHDRNEFLRNVFNYYCRNVVYQLDGTGTEEVHNPELTITNGTGDCKKAATFLASILIAAGIEPVFKHVYYEGEQDYTHIYIIVPDPDFKNYITLDPTNNCEYDKEVNYKSATLYFTNGTNMELRHMGKPAHTNKPAQHHGGGYSHNMFQLPFVEDIQYGTCDMLDTISHCAGVQPTTMQKGLHPLKTLIPSHKTYLHKDSVHPHTAILADIFEINPLTHTMAGPEYVGKLHLLDKLKSAVNSVVSTVTADVKKVITNVAPILTNVFDKFKTVALAIPRGAALLVIEANVHGVATHLLDSWTTNPSKVENMWKSIGGDVNTLKKAMIDGNKRKAILGPQYVGLAGIAAAIATAAPVLLLISKMIHEIKPGSDADNAVSGVASGAIAAASDPAFNPNAQEFVAHMDQTGNPVPAPHLPGQFPPNMGPSSGSVSGSLFGLIWKLLFILMLNPFNINLHIVSILAWFAIVAPVLIYYIFLKNKKNKTTWQI